MGIGSKETLHGYPDARVRAEQSDIHLITPSVSGDSNPGSPSSIGDSVVVEGKRFSSLFNTDQLIATNVVISFTEHNRHPDFNPLVPAIMICVPTAQICFYDCTKDILLLSNTFDWLRCEDGKRYVDKAAILLLWITVHHRYIIAMS